MGYFEVVSRVNPTSDLIAKATKLKIIKLAFSKKTNFSKFQDGRLIDGQKMFSFKNFNIFFKVKKLKKNIFKLQI